MWLAYTSSGVGTIILAVMSISLFCPGLITIGYVCHFIFWLPFIWREEIFLDKVNKFIKDNDTKIRNSLLGYRIEVDGEIVYQLFKPISLQTLVELKKIKTSDKLLKSRLNTFLNTPTRDLDLSIRKLNSIRYGRV